MERWHLIIYLIPLSHTDLTFFYVCVCVYLCMHMCVSVHVHTCVYMQAFKLMSM